MSLQDKINKDLKEAMKNRDVDRLAALRAVKAAIMLEATKDGNVVVSDDVSVNLIAKLVKQRRDAASIFIEQDRKDLADDELNQLKHLQDYLPKRMSEEEIRDTVKEVIKTLDLKNSGGEQIGACMRILIPKLNGRADNGIISKIVREELSM